MLFGVIPKARQTTVRMIVAPDTVLRWHHEVAGGRGSRRPGCQTIRVAAVACASWSCVWRGRTQAGVTAVSTVNSPALGIKLAPSTVWEILHRARIAPTPHRRSGPTWAEFLRGQADAIVATDFFAVDLLDSRHRICLGGDRTRE
jgi:putative transposase